MSGRRSLLPAAALFLFASCTAEEPPDPSVSAGAAPSAEQAVPTPDYTLRPDPVHTRFSAAIEPVLRVPSGSVIEAYTEEATGGQLGPDSDVDDVMNLDFDGIHALTGPVFVEGAQPGDVLAVTLHEVEVGEWGWAAIIPDFGFLADEFPDPYLRTWRFEPGQQHAPFVGDIRIPLRPFPGVMGVAPPTDEMLSTIPPRANGGNMDNRDLVAGTTVYFPVFVEGALFSIGDTHAAQGDAEISGTGIEAPMRIVYEVNVIEGEGERIPEPQYETDEYYGVSAYGESLDEAAHKTARFMVDYLTDAHGLTREDAYMLASLAANMKVAEVVDLPHMLVKMHISKEVLGTRGLMRF